MLNKANIGAKTRPLQFLVSRASSTLFFENNDSENMIIHGDNLEALKALLPQYEQGEVHLYRYLNPILMSILSSLNAVRLNFIIHIMFLVLFEIKNYNVLCGGAKWTI